MSGFWSVMKAIFVFLVAESVIFAMGDEESGNSCGKVQNIQIKILLNLKFKPNN